jgi:hypothetical protein
MAFWEDSLCTVFCLQNKDQITDVIFALCLETLALAAVPVISDSGDFRICPYCGLGCANSHKKIPLVSLYYLPAALIFVAGVAPILSIFFDVEWKYWVIAGFILILGLCWVFVARKFRREYYDPTAGLPNCCCSDSEAGNSTNLESSGFDVSSPRGVLAPWRKIQFATRSALRLPYRRRVTLGGHNAPWSIRSQSGLAPGMGTVAQPLGWGAWHPLYGLA